VVWTEPRASGHWIVGIQIVESDDTAFVEWVDAVAKAMTED
jgi:hypothetical protein